MKVIKKCLKIIITAALALVLTGIYAIKIEPHILLIKEYEIGKTEADEKVKIVQISDIQISKNYTIADLKKLIEKVNQQKPDIFLFTGDLFENYAEYAPEKEVIEELKKIEATYGKYAIWGNRDYGGGGERHYEEILEKSGIQLLENSAVTITTQKEHKIWIAGLDDYLLGSPDISSISEEARQEMDYKILLIHEPDMADSYKEYPFDLMLAGHSHGGQVRIPFMKGITTAMAHKYVRGFYQLDGTYPIDLYVNTGIGTSRYPIRFLVPPQIAVFNIGI